MSEHTPGPWTTDGLFIVAGGRIIGKFQREESFSNPESARNARIAAAAPNLLEACETVLDSVTSAEEYVIVSLTVEEYRQIEAAVKAAKGEAR